MESSSKLECDVSHDCLSNCPSTTSECDGCGKAFIASIDEPEQAEPDSFSHHFDLDWYNSGAVITPLYEGAITVLESIAQHLVWFTDHPGTTKQALTDLFKMLCFHKEIYCRIQTSLLLLLFRSLLLNHWFFYVCPNDCILFRGSAGTLDSYSKCGAS